MSVRDIVDQALKDIRAETQHRYNYTAVDMYNGTSVTRGPIFAGTKSDAIDVEQAVNTALYDLGQRLIYDLCDHQWVNAANEVVLTGEYCSECNMIRRHDGLGLQASSPPG